MVTIVLDAYGMPHPADLNELWFVNEDDGKKACLETDFVETLKATETDVVIKATGSKKRYSSRRDSRISKKFVRGFMRPAIKELGIDFVLSNLKVQGCPVKVQNRSAYNSSNSAFLDTCVLFLKEEKKRLDRAAAKKAKEATPDSWSEDIRFQIPDIGTQVKLKEDWVFRLYHERRNTLLGQIGIKVGYRREEVEKFSILTIKKGSILTVDRVYIRKGVSKYSSVTFHLLKGGEYSFSPAGKTINGKITKGQTRFWAKLSDVNRMLVSINTNSLAKN